MLIKGGITDILSLLTISICVFFLALSGKVGAQIPNEIFQPPEFTNSDDILTESGYFKLEWKTSTSEKEILFELQQSFTPSFSNPTIIYQGNQSASFISGMPDGEYFYRIRQIHAGDKSPWSKSTVVKVKHHSLSLAWLLFGLGGLVFMATAILVIHGSIKSGKYE